MEKISLSCLRCVENGISLSKTGKVYATNNVVSDSPVQELSSKIKGSLGISYNKSINYSRNLLQNLR